MTRPTFREKARAAVAALAPAALVEDAEVGIRVRRKRSGPWGLIRVSPAGPSWFCNLVWSREYRGPDRYTRCAAALLVQLRRVERGVSE